MKNFSCRENIRAKVFSLATILALAGCGGPEPKVVKPYVYSAKPHAEPGVTVVRPRESW